MPHLFMDSCCCCEIGLLIPKNKCEEQLAETTVTPPERVAGEAASVPHKQGGEKKCLAHELAPDRAGPPGGGYGNGDPAEWEERGVVQAL